MTFHHHSYLVKEFVRISSEILLASKKIITNYNMRQPSVTCYICNLIKVPAVPPGSYSNCYSDRCLGVKCLFPEPYTQLPWLET